MFEMKPEYYIGIDMIDQEHKQLFDYANEAYELLQEEFTPDKYDKIDAILEKLRDYTVKHFTDEEAYMESIQYKKIFTQKIQHQEFIKKLDEFIDQHEKDEGDQEEQDEQIMDILNYLTDWLINHILPPDYGYAQAEAVVFFVLVAAVTMIQVAVTKSNEVEA